MSNEQKVCCGGFFIGDGLEMDGKTLKALGGGSEGGYTYYPVSCSVVGYTDPTVTISESYETMYANILNKKIPFLIDSDEEYGDFYYLQNYDDWQLQFIQMGASTNGKYHALNWTQISIDADNVSKVDKFAKYCGTSVGFNKTGDTWSCTKPFTYVFSVFAYDIVATYKGADNLSRYSYPLELNANYVVFSCNYPTTTGIHFDYFKLNKNETVEYTSKDITV